MRGRFCAIAVEQLRSKNSRISCRSLAPFR